MVCKNLSWKLFLIGTNKRIDSKLQIKKILLNNLNESDYKKKLQLYIDKKYNKKIQIPNIHILLTGVYILSPQHCEIHIRKILPVITQLSPC